MDRVVPAGQPAWLKALIVVTAGALVMLISVDLIGDVSMFATTHTGTSFSALLLVLVGAILFARKRSGRAPAGGRPNASDTDVPRATESGTKSAEIHAEIGSPQATESGRPGATASAHQAGDMGAENRAGKRRWSKYYLIMGVNLGLIAFAAWWAWSWYSKPRLSEAEIPAQNAAAGAVSAHAMPSSNLSDLQRPGTLFSGTETELGRADSRFVLSEITDAPAGAQKVSAVLRNDGGWSDARAYQGEWMVGPDEAGKLILRTRNSDRIPGAGPMLDDPGAFALVLQFRAGGSAIVSPGKWTIRRLDPAAAAAIKTDLNRAARRAEFGRFTARFGAIPIAPAARRFSCDHGVSICVLRAVRG